MKKKRFKKQMRANTTFLFLILLFTLYLAACGDKSEEAGPGSSLPANAFIENAELVSTDGCIDVSLYSRRIQSLDPQIPVLHVTKDFSQSSRNSLRRDFSVLNAYSVFLFEWLPMSQAALEFDGFTQEGCETVTFLAPDGTPEVFKITEATSTSLKADAEEEGKRIEFHWLSPNSVEIKQRYRVYDVPCTNDSSFVEFTKILDWSGVQPGVIPEGSRLSVDSEYLEQVADAVGFNVNDLYDGQRSLVFSKLVELGQQPVRPEVLSCSGAPIDVPEVPDPDLDPNRPEEPEEPEAPEEPEQPEVPAEPVDPVEPAP